MDLKCEWKERKEKKWKMHHEKWGKKLGQRHFHDKAQRQQGRHLVLVDTLFCKLKSTIDAFINATPEAFIPLYYIAEASSKWFTNGFSLQASWAMTVPVPFVNTKTNLFAFQMVSSVSVKLMEGCSQCVHSITGLFEEHPIEIEQVSGNSHPRLRRGHWEEAISDQNLWECLTVTRIDIQSFEACMSDIFR
jgi:hypothetical protein